MKKSKWTAMILGTLLTASLLCFSACTPQQTEEQDPSIPDMAWGGSVSDTLKALDTDTASLGEQAVLDESTGAGNVVVMGAELFGQKTEGVVLGFDGTEDGLHFYRRIADECRPFLREGGSIYLEIGFDQAKDVREIFEASGFSELKVIKDLAGKDRVVKGKWMGA